MAEAAGTASVRVQESMRLSIGPRLQVISKASISAAGPASAITTLSASSRTQPVRPSRRPRARAKRTKGAPRRPVNRSSAAWISAPPPSPSLPLK